MERYKKKAIVLLGEYHKREVQIKLLEVECQAMEQLVPGVSALSYDQMSAHTNKVSSPVESAVQNIERLPEDLAKIRKQIIWMQTQNRKIDITLDAMTEPCRTVVKLKYMELLPWIQVYPKCAGYSEEYIRKELSEKALLMFISLYYPETNRIGLFAEDGYRDENR